MKSSKTVVTNIFLLTNNIKEELLTVICGMPKS
jgi:hypothetical protein